MTDQPLDAAVSRLTYSEVRQRLEREMFLTDKTAQAFLAVFDYIENELSRLRQAASEPPADEQPAVHLAAMMATRMKATLENQQPPAPATESVTPCGHLSGRELTVDGNFHRCLECRKLWPIKPTPCPDCARLTTELAEAKMIGKADYTRQCEWRDKCHAVEAELANEQASRARQLAHIETLEATCAKKTKMIGELREQLTQQAAPHGLEESFNAIAAAIAASEYNEAGVFGNSVSLRRGTGAVDCCAIPIAAALLQSAPPPAMSRAEAEKKLRDWCGASDDMTAALDVLVREGEK
jgi:hypothetical protein